MGISERWGSRGKMMLSIYVCLLHCVHVTLKLRIKIIFDLHSKQPLFIHIAPLAHKMEYISLLVHFVRPDCWQSTFDNHHIMMIRMKRMKTMIILPFHSFLLTEVHVTCNAWNFFQKQNLCTHQPLWFGFFSFFLVSVYACVRAYLQSFHCLWFSGYSICFCILFFLFTFHSVAWL